MNEVFYEKTPAYIGDVARRDFLRCIGLGSVGLGLDLNLQRCLAETAPLDPAADETKAQNLFTGTFIAGLCIGARGLICWLAVGLDEEDLKRVTESIRTTDPSLDVEFRVLQPGRLATVDFNNSNGRFFEAVKRAVRDAGFEVASTVLLDSEPGHFMHLKEVGGEDVVDKDVQFNLYKPPPEQRGQHPKSSLAARILTT